MQLENVREPLSRPMCMLLKWQPIIKRLLIQNSHADTVQALTYTVLPMLALHCVLPV